MLLASPAWHCRLDTLCFVLLGAGSSRTSGKVTEEVQDKSGGCQLLFIWGDFICRNIAWVTLKGHLPACSVVVARR